MAATSPIHRSLRDVRASTGAGGATPAGSLCGKKLLLGSNTVSSRAGAGASGMFAAAVAFAVATAEKPEASAPEGTAVILDSDSPCGGRTPPMRNYRPHARGDLHVVDEVRRS
jgi:hypothetical protein